MENEEIRKLFTLFTSGITEDFFIENFEELMEYNGFKRFEPYDEVTKTLARLVRVDISDCLNRIYRMNTTKNKWANINNISDKLKLFLALKGENI
jgi:hypothetical protein